MKSWVCNYMGTMLLEGNYKKWRTVLVCFYDVKIIKFTNKFLQGNIILAVYSVCLVVFVEMDQNILAICINWCTEPADTVTLFMACCAGFFFQNYLSLWKKGKHFGDVKSIETVTTPRLQIYCQFLCYATLFVIYQQNNL